MGNDRDCGSQSVHARLLDVETGVLEDHVRARIISQGAREVKGPRGLRVMFFEKVVRGKVKTFSVPRAMGPDGYRVHELDIIERELQPLDIELYPIDAHLN